MTRSDERAQALRDAGATAVVCDVFDADGRARGDRGCTARGRRARAAPTCPPNLDPRKMEEQAAGNDRMRSEGTRNLVAAARRRRRAARGGAEHRVRVRAGGAALKTEEDPLWDDAPVAVVAQHPGAARPRGHGHADRRHRRESCCATASSTGPGRRTPTTATSPARCAGGGLPIVGKGSGVFSFIHVDDAAAATVAAMEHGAPGIYNVVDDEPGAAARVGSRLCARRWARSPRGACRCGWRGCWPGATWPAWRPRWAAPPTRRPRRELGWQPRYASWRQGFREALG